MTTSTPEKQDGLKALNDAIEVIRDKITSLGGVFNIQMAVSITSKRFCSICVPNENSFLILSWLCSRKWSLLRMRQNWRDKWNERN